MGPLVDQLKKSFIHQFAARGGASWIGKALPFGIGAAIGGAGNNILGRRVLVNSRRAFGVAPAVLPPELEPRPGAARFEHAATRSLRRAGGAVAGGVTRGATAVGSGARRVITIRRREDIEAADAAQRRGASSVRSIRTISGTTDATVARLATPVAPWNAWDCSHSGRSRTRSGRASRRSRSGSRAMPRDWRMPRPSMPAGSASTETGVPVESIVIPVVPVIEIAEVQESGEGES